MPLIHDRNRKWWVLATTTLTLGMVFIDQTIVNVSLPTIQRDFHASDTALQWIINAYLLTLACFLITGGRLGDLYGVKACFLIGISIFTISSFFCGFAQNETRLIINRGIQGIGGALLIPSLMATFMNTVELHERGKLMGIQASVAGIFLVLGPFFGGLITQTIGWPWIFWVNIPIGIIAFTLAWFSIKLPRHESAKKESLDIRGSILLTIGMFSIVFVLMEGGNWHWVSGKVIGLFILGCVALSLLIVFEKKAKHPLIDLQLFKNKDFFSSIIIISCLQVALISSVFSTLYTQSNLGYNPLNSGLLILPGTVPIFILTPIAGRIFDKKGPYPLVIIGMLVLSLGLFWMASFSFFNNYLYFLPGFIFFGIGVSLVISPISTTALNTVPSHKRGTASGIVSSMRQVGGAIGLAIVGALFVFGQRSRFSEFLNTHAFFRQYFDPEDVSYILNNADGFQNKLVTLNPEDMLLLKNAAKLAFNWGFFISISFAATICLIGAIIGWHFLRKFKAVVR